MNLYMISQRENNDYDTYDSVMVICSNDEHLRIERWVYDAWKNGNLADPLLLAVLNRAVTIIIEW